VPVQPAPISVPGSAPLSETIPSWWSIGPPGGFLYPVIQPNPIPGLIFPPSSTPPVVGVVPPVIVPPGLWPQPPLLPVSPWIPGQPLQPVPEPALLPVTALALAAAGWARSRRRSLDRPRRHNLQLCPFQSSKVSSKAADNSISARISRHRYIGTYGLRAGTDIILDRTRPLYSVPGRRLRRC
jgi:hypothetical protein